MIRFLPLWLLFFACTTATNDTGARPQEPGLAPPDTTTEPPLPTAIDTARLRYLTGKFDPAKHPDFVPVADKYTDGDPYLLHRDTYAAFERMHAAALADGVELVMVSATRNFARQKQIWEAKWTGKRILSGGTDASTIQDPGPRARAILRYSSMPGTSRHHWGSDIDLNALNNRFFDSGAGKKIYDWLTANASDYGFCQPYTPKGPERPNGYEEERWHWSYLPVAQPLTDFAAEVMTDRDIDGFLGAEAAPAIGVIDNYVLGINSRCLR